MLEAAATGQPARPGSPQRPPAERRIRIVDLDNAILSTRQRVSREAIVEVDDENGRPVGGVLLTFSAPRMGPSAVFQDGKQFLTLTTDDRGQAVLRGIRPNTANGNYTIHVTATDGPLSAATDIHLTNFTPIGHVIPGKWIAVIAAGAAAAVAGGVYAATSGGSNSGGSTGGGGSPLPTVGLQLGTPAVGPPR